MIEARRRDAIDVARILALFVVVLGHLLLAVVDRVDGDIRGANLLALHPGWAWVAAVAPMPVFFAAGGWANATATLATARPRLRALVGLGAVVVVGWSAAVVVTSVVAGDPGIVGDGARVATQPLWFLAAYLPFAAAGARLASLGSKYAPWCVGGSLALLTVLDIARFGFGAPTWVGWPGFFLAWGTPWVVGAWWRSRYEAGGFAELRTGLTITGVAALGCVALVAAAGYEPTLIDAVHDTRSNTTPPTLYTAVAALAQVGLLLAGARALDRAGRRWRPFWDRAGEAAVGVYVWHLTALVLCVAIIAAGFPVPDRLTVLWWSTRPVWWAVVLLVTAGFVAATDAVRRRLPRPRDLGRPLVWAGFGVVVAAAGGAAVGLEGPQSSVLALLCSALFVGGWRLLR